jgi:hypothetical protein
VERGGATGSDVIRSVIRYGQYGWKIQKKSKLNSENIWKLWKKSKLNSEKIGKIWKKGKSNSDKIWTIWMENTEEK